MHFERSKVSALLLGVNMIAFIKNFFQKFKITPTSPHRYAKRCWREDAAVAVAVFLAVFAILFWRVSWNTRPVLEKSADTVQSTASFAATVSQDILPNNDSDDDGLENDLEIVHGTDPMKADSDGDGFTDRQEITNGYDPAAPGDARPAVEITIAKIGVTAPMVWSKSENEKDQLADLAGGVAHFSKTASPGQNGNMIISGHSSNYVWAKGNFNYIFKNLNNIAPGDVADVKTVQQNGKTIVYHYKISEKFTTVPNDARIFESGEKTTLTLSTCWPIGSNARRLIVRGELI